MSDEPSRHEPVEAEIVHEAQEVPPGAPPPLPKKRYEYVPRKKKNPFFGFPMLIVLMIFVTMLAFIFRARLTDTYERFFPETKKQKAEIAPGPSNEKESTPEVKPPPVVEPEAEVKLPPPPRREDGEEETDEGEVIPVTPWGKDAPEGIAYAIVGRENMGYERVFRWEFKVIVPAGYGEQDILRAARKLVSEERKKRLYHALRLYFFIDRAKLDPAADAVAEVVWAPEGNFGLAENALVAGTQANTFRVTMKK